MPSTVLAASALANGLRTDFWDAYDRVRIESSDGRLGRVMQLGVPADNREHEFTQWNAAPHLQQWRRGDPIPQDAHESVSWTTPVYTWGRRIAWHKEDRKDDRTQALPQSARGAGRSAGLMPERMFFDVIAQSTVTLPGNPLAPDGAAIYSTTTGGGANRFGVTNGNLLPGNTVDNVSAIRADFYAGVAQAKQFQDGKGQPLLPDDVTDGEIVICFAASNLEAFEETFLQRRQGIVEPTSAGTTPTNLVQDASRNVILWPTSRLTGDDWYMFFAASPLQAVYELNREGIQEFEALEDGNNSDHVRDTGEEYIQWDMRSGAGVNEPYATIKINN